jgi:hypothetical protein
MYMLSALYENCDFAHGERGKHLLLPKYNRATTLWPSIRVTTAGSDKTQLLEAEPFANYATDRRAPSARQSGEQAAIQKISGYSTKLISTGEHVNVGRPK